MRLLLVCPLVVGLLAFVFLAGRAFASPAGPATTDLSGFTGTPPAGTHFTVRPIYRETTRPTRYRLHRVPCATAALGDTSACYAAR